MLRLALSVLFSAASAACGFAAVGLALYAQGPSAGSAALLFGAFGAVAGLLCAALHAVVDGLPAQRGQALSGPALAGLVRATLASAAAERQARPGSAADRRPAPAAPPAPVVAARADAPEPRHFASSAFGA